MAKTQPKILWANPYCLLDLSSGASMTAREQLRQLHNLGWDVRVLGATIFDSPNGITRLSSHWEKIKQSRSRIVKVNDSPLTHHLVKTKSTQRSEMKASEEATWYQAYIKFLDEFKPDIVYYYGGRTLDLLIGDEAHARGIPVAAYLANGNFSGKRWCREVDLILTNAEATATHYKQKDDIQPKAVGVFIDPSRVIATDHRRENVLFVNPSLAKGAAIVVRLAMLLAKTRPDIQFEVIESRGQWQSLVTQISKQYGNPVKELPNVRLTANTNDMRPIYGRARVLLAPSLWWEAYGRVIAEAHMNGVPTIATNRGGLPEATGQGGLLFDFPTSCYKSPYQKIPTDKSLKKVLDAIIKIHNNSEFYDDLQKKAFIEGKKQNIYKKAKALEEKFNTLLQSSAYAT